MFSNEYIPFIIKPTRDAGNSATLIDNIFMNTVLNESTLIGLFYTDITDHYPIFYIDSKNVSSDVPSRKQRVYNDMNVRKCVDCLAALDSWNVLDCTDSQDSYSYFHCQISTIYNKCFPIKTYLSSYSHRKLRLTNNIKIAIKKKNELWSKYKRYRSAHLEAQYYDCKRILQKNNTLYWEGILSSNVRRKSQQHCKIVKDGEKHNQ